MRKYGAERKAEIPRRRTSALRGQLAHTTTMRANDTRPAVPAVGESFWARSYPKSGLLDTLRIKCARIPLSSITRWPLRHMFDCPDLAWRGGHHHERADRARSGRFPCQEDEGVRPIMSIGSTRTPRGRKDSLRNGARTRDHPRRSVAPMPACCLKEKDQII